MAFPGSVYAPPGVYTQTNFEDPLQGVASNARIPLLIGTGSEILTQNALELVRGSSSSVDQRIVQEDETGRAVVSISQTGVVTLGAFDGELDRIQVKNHPIVTGDGTGTTATDTGTVSVTLNGEPVVVLAIDGAKGILKLSTSPKLGDEVRVTYFFNRTDTLITDNLAEQITPDAPVLLGAVNQPFEVIAGVNDTLNILVDDQNVVNVVISPSASGSPWAAAQIAAFVNAAASGTSLSASTDVDNFGNTVVKLVADSDIEIQDGLANSTLGLTLGQKTLRNQVFFTFQRPIVDGSNGGVTTTDPADVTVKVDGVQVIPTAVDGNTGAVTLPFAPKVGATVTCQYYFNSWQDTFDYLAHRGITNIFQCGLTPDRFDYRDGADFVLKDDLILWGTATLTESGLHTAGSEFFDGTQIGTSLVDTRTYLTECSAVVDTSVNPPNEGRKVFKLPLTATTGNGRNTPIGTSTYQTVSNGRIDLPTDRPDLIFAYWGFSIEDALDRGRITVSKVDSTNNQITLAEPVPVGATVYASFYYNTLQDQEYTLSVTTAGASGVGAYSVKNENGESLLTPSFGGKSAGLATVTIQFPSGTERLPDCRFESPFDATAFTGAVEEDVTVEFAQQDATLAKYSIPGKGPYYIISGASDHFDVEIDNSALTGGFVNLSDPTGAGCGFSAQLVGNEVVYSADSGSTTYDIDATNNSVELLMDGKLVQAKVPLASGRTLADYALCLNQATFGIHATADAGALSSITLPASVNASDVEDYYKDWKLVITSGTAAAGTIHNVDASSTAGVLTIDGAVTPDNTSVFHLYNPNAAPSITGRTRFLSPVVISAGEYDDIVIQYTGSDTGTVAITTAGVSEISPGTYNSASLLVSAVQTAVDAAIGAIGAFATYKPTITVSSDTSGRLVFSLISSPEDLQGAYIEFVTGLSGEDFCELAGFDTDSAAGGQAKLIAGNIARRYTFTGAVTSELNNDRLILRNRIIPGQSGTLDGEFTLSQASLKVLGGSGNDNCGLTANEIAQAGIRATVMEPTLFGEVGLGGGQVPAATHGDARDGQPLVTFEGPSSTNPQNNVFKFTFEGVPVTVEFKDASGSAITTSAEVSLGPIGSANTILAQIQAAMVAQGLASGLVMAEGAGIRFRGASSAAGAVITIGNGSANDILGFAEGDESFRTVVDPEVLVSGLMAHDQASIAAHITSWASGGASSYFTAKALAKVVRDSANAEYLFLQSRGTAGAGTTSSVAIVLAASDSVTRPGTGLGVEPGDGNVGDPSIDGFFVISSDPVNGSGSGNISSLNNGVGQDGNVGQTYRDIVTGLTFTILPREGGATYPAGATITFNVRKVVTTDSNLPVNAIPGIELLVSNTLGIAVGDTAIVSTYERGGAEPAVGDVYYVSYNYRKQDFSSQIFTKQSAVEAAFGAKTPSNPVSLGAYLAFLNGAVILAIKQVEKDEDINNDGTPDSASIDSFLKAIDDVSGTLPGGVFPDYLVPMRGDSLELFQYLAQHCDVQSSIRFRAERTAIVGLSAGTQPREAGNIASAIKRSRLRILYPDIVTLSLTKADGSVQSYLVDGTYMAAAFAGNRASPTIDVATPWTRARILGFDEIARTLDAVQQNQVAVRGVTVVGQDQRVVSVRQGLTTDVTNVLTKTPTVITIADEVQKRTRNTLDRFVGIKFLAGITSQIEAQVSSTLKNLVQSQIIATYTGVSANVSPDDPTAVEVEAYYQPVFPLLYIIVTYNLRASL